MRVPVTDEESEVVVVDPLVVEVSLMVELVVDVDRFAVRLVVVSDSEVYVNDVRVFVTTVFENVAV